MTKASNLLLRVLNIKQEEAPKFFPLFWHSFFLGIFIAIYFVPANSIFIVNFGSKFLPIAYMAAGLTGYIATSIYSYIQKRVNNRNLFLGALAFMFVVPLLAWLSLGKVSEKWLSFFIFIWVWPFISLVNIESGGLTLKMLNIRQVKRMFGLINIGGVLSSILMNFTIPIIVRHLHHAYDLILFAITGPVAAFIVVLMIYKRFPDKPVKDDEAEEEVTVHATFKDMIKDRYYMLIFAAASLSMIMIYFTDFGYLSSIKAQKQYIGTPEQISQFIALVAGVMKLGEFFLSLASNRILSRFGVKLGLTALPLATTLLIACAAVCGLITGVESILFFSIMVVNKLAERIIRRGLDDPSFNVLYQPLPQEIQLSVQTQVGVVTQISIGIAGILLFSISSLLTTSTGFKLEYYALFFLPLLLSWAFVARKLFFAYKRRLRQLLSDKSRDKKRDISKHTYGIELLKRNIKNENKRIVEVVISILSETNPRILEPYSSFLLKIGNPTITKSVLHTIDPTWRHRISSMIAKLAKSNDVDLDIRQLAEEIVKRLDYSEIEAMTLADFERIKNSDEQEGKVKLLKYVSQNKTLHDEEIIMRLLNDNDPIIVYAAMQTAGEKLTPLLLTKLIDLVKSNEHYHVIREILLVAGENVVAELEKLIKSDKSHIVLRRVVEIFAKLGTLAARNALLKLLNYPDREIQLEVIQALHFCRYEAELKESQIIKDKLENIIDNILWLQASIRDVENEKNTLKLVQSLDFERENRIEVLFKLLSFLYDPLVIGLIKKNVIGENTIFALEIIDNFIDPDIKYLIMPLFDDISVAQRLKKLHSIFPQEKLKFTDRLKLIIIKNFMYSDSWTRAKAIELLSKIHKRTQSDDTTEDQEMTSVDVWTEPEVNKLLAIIRKSEMPDEIFAALYHPDEMVYSTAAKIVYDENPTRCFNYIKRLTPKKQELIAILTDNQDKLITEKIKMLKRLITFFNIPENYLIPIASILTPINLKRNETISFTYCNECEVIFFVVKGTISYSSEIEEVKFAKNDIIIRGITTHQNTTTLTAKRDTTLLQGKRTDYFNLLVDYPEITHYILNNLTSEVTAAQQAEAAGGE